MSGPDSLAPPVPFSRPIRRLDPQLVDQIAAGEVVERPASVVKELVENALDAGAGRVRVEVREGGASLVAVTDDGCGMAPDEARLALERHATSKLATADDLRRIATFGFRGEALPAIASVSRLRLRTRPAGRTEAFEVLIEGGKLLGEGETAGAAGTRVEVADLFAAVPARRKFLKSAATEWSHLIEWLGRAALALPGVHFDVWRDGREALAWPAARDPLDRIAAVLSEADAAALLPFDGAAVAGRVHGFASRSEHHRPSAAGLHLFVNRRPVRDRLLRHALLEVYRDVLPRGRYPTALLFVELAPEAVDVNVHPAKWEVRFADPRGIHHLVTSALREGIGARRWLREPSSAPEPARGQAWSPPPAVGPVARTPPGDWLFARPAEGEAGIPGPEAAPRFADLGLVGQALGTYLVLEGADGIVLVDQHAAHERVLYENLRAGWLAGAVESQPLLMADTVELGAAAVGALAAQAEVAQRLGFEIEPFGPGTVAVRAVPALLAGRDPRPLVRALADELQDARDADAPADASSRALAAADRALATLACHAARRAGDPLPREEQRALLAALDEIPWAPTCPHGRPVALPLARAEIERRFGRR